MVLETTTCLILPNFHLDLINTYFSWQAWCIISHHVCHFSALNSMVSLKRSWDIKQGRSMRKPRYRPLRSNKWGACMLWNISWCILFVSERLLGILFGLFIRILLLIFKSNLIFKLIIIRIMILILTRSRVFWYIFWVMPWDNELKLTVALNLIKLNVLEIIQIVPHWMIQPLNILILLPPKRIGFLILIDGDLLLHILSN